jgi:hypothetical protein
LLTLKSLPTCSARMGASDGRDQADRAECERAELERVVNAASSEVRMVERAWSVLCASEALKGSEIAERVACLLPTVVKWRGRYGCDRIDGLRDAPRPGPPLTHGPRSERC